MIIHAGAEGSSATHVPVGDETFMGEDRGDARAFAHAAIDAGAAAVIGSGPHVPGVEDYRGHLIAYSRETSSVIARSDTAACCRRRESCVSRSRRRTMRSGRWISVALVDGIPRPDRSNSVAEFVAALSAEDFPADHLRFSPGGPFHG